MKNFFETVKDLSSNKLYLYYSLAYGLSTLIVPLTIQYLVNNLALSGLWLNITVFVVFVLIGLSISYMIKHSQLVILESLQREIFSLESKRWMNVKKKDYSYYFFEVFNLLKSFAKSYSNIIELSLIMIFGLFTIILFHPIFIPVAIIIIVTIFQIYKSSAPALNSSIAESDQKYKLHSLIKSESKIDDSHLLDFLNAREKHFRFVRTNSFKVAILAVFIQTIIIALGSYLIRLEQLSVGQLVSAEIIISGIFISLSKLPKTLEAIYDYETSKYKIEKALGGHDE